MPLVTRALLGVACIVCIASCAGTTSAQAAPFYRRSHSLDITGTNPRDSIVLVATGARADKLAIAMTFFVNGAVAHVQRWTSADALADDALLKEPPAKVGMYLRAALDATLAQTKREPINAEQVQHMGDAALLKRITPRPTHQLALSFGVENTLYFVWNPTKRKLELFMECC